MYNNTKNVPTKEDIIPMTNDVPDNYKTQVQQLAGRMINHPAFGRNE